MRRGRQRNGDVIESETEGETSPSGITDIPTDLLRTFVAICELGSFTKAAHLFELTQPAVSAHMRRLESLIGADLLEKSLSGVTLTECGAEVLRYARRMLAINDQIVSGGGLQSQAQVVRLGIPNLYAPMCLPASLSSGKPSAANTACRSAAIIRAACCAACARAISRSLYCLPARLISMTPLCNGARTWCG